MDKVKKIVRKTMTVRITPELHAKLKALVKFKSITIQSVMAQMAEDFVNENFTDDMIADDDAVNDYLQEVDEVLN
ncbi:MAG: hypothetical protein WCT23_09840 [Candidatus Neomarinimicrobiota bacterium]